MGDRPSNFGFLKGYDPSFAALGAAAERLLLTDPDMTVVKLRTLGEQLAQYAAAASGVYAGPEVSQLEVLRSLKNKRIVEGRAADLFHHIRTVGNHATHGGDVSRKNALETLKIARQMAIWFHRTFGGAKASGWKPGPFIEPEDPAADLRQREEAEANLRALLAEQQEAAELQRELAAAEAARREEAERLAELLQQERDTALELAEEVEREAAARAAELAAQLEQMQESAASQPDAVQRAQQVTAARAEDEISLSEDETRVIIDGQLRAAGWEVDSSAIRYAAGARPQKGRNMAIAEWPAGKGRADYVLFVGLTPVGVVEAKRKNKNVAGALEQSKRYSREFTPVANEELAGPATHWAPPDGWPVETGGDKRYWIPFLFSTNGREYHRQLETQSGIWFLDARRPTNHSRALMGWPTPEGLIAQLEQDVDDAHQKLHAEPTDYLGLRPYQLQAVEAVEQAIEAGKRELLLAMATGTGKTKTTIGLIYRLLKANRFHRVLFLVDRTALGEQAQNAFKDMRLEANQTFAEIFEVKELTDVWPEASTRVHVATVQGMVKRCLQPTTDDDLVPIDQYDAIIVDESHRGYNLDQEMSEGEMEMRSLADYVSVYRRVLDYFDAVRIGLTATPALHTLEIFGPPVFTYSYREAVVDGWLVDHEPPVRLLTRLADEGIRIEAGSEVTVVKPGQGSQLELLPDEVEFEVADFNKRVIAPDFTRVVCEALADHLDPTGDEKTLVFCCTDDHADRVVVALKKAFVEKWGELDDNAVQKITGATDKPMEAIRRYRNEQQPNVAVTVDLLTTGVDIPKIANLVFLRRVRSRILYEQMLGRATRLAPKIGKEVFRIYDAVGIYDALEDVVAMRPVVTSTNVSFQTLAEELRSDKAHEAPGRQEGTTHADDVRDQMVARLRRQANRAAGLEATPPAWDEAVGELRDLAGHDPAELADALNEMDAAEARRFFEDHPGIEPALSKVFVSLRGLGNKALLYEDEDELIEVTHGYGTAERPEDYLESFKQFVDENKNHIAALNVVLTRPRELTRAQLKELRVALHSAGYTEPNIRAAWRDVTNQDIAASIIGWIRQQALGSPLVPYEERVSRALNKVKAMQAWTKPQQKWLERIAKQLEKERIVDHEAFGVGAFKQHGGFKGVDKQLGGKLEQVLDAFGDGIWEDAA